MMDFDDYEPDWNDGDGKPDDSENAPCSPAKCGDCWLGDDLCDKELNAMSDQEAEFQCLYVKEAVACPVCALPLTQYSIPADELWVWPGVWPGGAYYSPIIALNIFAILGAPKGKVHSMIDGQGTVWHIWVGEGQYRDEKLIRLTGSLREAAAGS